MTERFADRVSELGDGLGEIANQLRDQLEVHLTAESASGWNLHEIRLQFSVDLQASAGVVIAKASTSAGFVASMSWRRAQS